MSQYLPVGGFRFLSEEEISKIDFANVPDDSDIGFAVECDLEYPSELHEYHNDYPLAPEHTTITETMLSPYCKCMNLKHAFTEKLIGNLQTKIKYESLSKFETLSRLGHETTARSPGRGVPTRVVAKTLRRTQYEKAPAGKDRFRKGFL
jgi:hypothetical protein